MLILLCNKKGSVIVFKTCLFTWAIFFLSLDLSNVFNNRFVELALVFSFFFRGTCIVATILLRAMNNEESHAERRAIVFSSLFSVSRCSFL